MAVVGTGSTSSVAGSDFFMCMIAKACTEVDTNFGIDWLGTAHVDTMLTPVHPETSRHFSLNRCRKYFLSRACMLCNIFLHVLLTYKTYKKYLLGYSQYFVGIGTYHRDALSTSISDTMVVLGCLMGLVHLTQYSS